MRIFPSLAWVLDAGRPFGILPSTSSSGCPCIFLKINLHPDDDGIFSHSLSFLFSLSLSLHIPRSLPVRGTSFLARHSSTGRPTVLWKAAAVAATTLFLRLDKLPKWISKSLDLKPFGAHGRTALGASKRWCVPVNCHLSHCFVLFCYLFGGCQCCLGQPRASGQGTVVYVNQNR